MKTIFKLAIALLAVFSFAACSDVPMPYEEPGTGNTSEDTYLDETFETSFGKFTNVTVKGNAWAIDYKTAKATGYDNSSQKTTASEAYLVSSPVDLSKSAAAYLQFEYILRYVRAGQTENKVLITDNYTGNPTTTTWTDITGSLTEGSDWTTYATYKKNIPSEFLGKSNVVIALMYSCTTTSSTIEIKNLIMKDGTVEESGTTTPETPATGEEAKGSGTQADPYNAAAANKAAEGLKDGEEKKDVYVSGTISQIKELSTQFGNASFYISDDGKTEGSQFYVFRALYLNGDKFTAEDQIKVGQKVVVKGSLVNFKGNTPELAQGGQVVSVEGSGTTTPETPTSGDITMKAGDFGVDTETDMGTQTLSDGTKLSFENGSNSKNGPKYYSTGSGTIRLYPGNTIAINAGSKKVASITIVCDSYKGIDYIAEGKLTSTKGTVSLSNLTYTISNIDASTFTLTNGDTGTGGKTQLRILSMSITYAK